MSNGLFLPDFRGAGTPGAPGVGSTRRGLEQARQAEQLTQTQQIGLQATSDEARLQSLIRGAVLLKQIRDPQRKEEFLIGRIQQLEANGIDSSDTREALARLQAGDLAGLEELTDQAISLGQQAEPVAGAGEREFKSLIKGLPEEQQLEATLIKLGIKPRAVSSADITIAESPELTEQIADSKAIIGQRKKFGELTGSSRAKTIDAGFEKIAKIDLGIGNIDRALDALNRGAGVGAIEKFLPSFKAASVELDNIQKSMALDVIGAVTFGALSAGELNLAKEVALPTGLDTPELIAHLNNRKAAQEKLRAYFNEQIQFLDQGGTVAGFLRRKESEQGAQQPPPTTTEPQATPQAQAIPQQAAQPTIIRFDAQGNIVQ